MNWSYGHQHNLVNNPNVQQQSLHLQLLKSQLIGYDLQYTPGANKEAAAKTANWKSWKRTKAEPSRTTEK